ncbi:MAG: hypothetical protein ETSY2_14155 [Candidatus Entotheonella gemina]|uniref:Uncharacterized protein n=1 Tax=Candidatus Entotheonella gemina TaxID=1429439 RepID=W4M9T5_9BACT|nr:MAG: hypothetical protein ETSY2_14155 [Candidatus Entotheonella gemina]
MITGNNRMEITLRSVLYMAFGGGDVKRLMLVLAKTMNLLASRGSHTM